MRRTFPGDKRSRKVHGVRWRNRPAAARQWPNGDELEVAMKPMVAQAGEKRFDRITFDPEVMGGRACIRGMRVTVATIVDRFAEGAALDDVLAEYPYLEREDVRQALAYAAWLARDEVIPAESAPVRFLVDANLSPRVAEWLQSQRTMPPTSSTSGSATPAIVRFSRPRRAGGKSC